MLELVWRWSVRQPAAAALLLLPLAAGFYGVALRLFAERQRRIALAERDKAQENFGLARDGTIRGRRK